MIAFFRRLLSPVVELREREVSTALMMFAYSFLVMTSYTALKPVTRSQFIKDLGADNLPFVQFAFGLLIGFIMQGYSTIVGRMPRRWALPMTLGGLVGLLVAFWVWFQSGSTWASTGFYFFGLILGILVISQFWTLANEVYDPRQAKRIFGFIGGGASLGGIAGSSLTLQAERIGTANLLLVSAALMTLCLMLVTAIIKREKPEIKGSLTGGEDEGVSSTEALRLLKNSRHLQTIALIIAFAAIGAAIVEQQLNMATEAAKGQGNTDSITSFLGEVQLYTSIIGFVIQVWLVSKIQRYLGIGFALLILPISLGLTGSFMLVNGALLAPMIARVIDTSLRYTVDKTTREILFLPLPNDLKQQAKPFIDVTVDRFAKGLGALLVLVLIKDWGLGLGWQQLSWASLTMIGLWIVADIRAKREYQAVFRRTLERQDVAPEALRLNEADLSTIETLVEEQGASRSAPRALRDRDARVAEQAAPDLAAAAESRVASGAGPRADDGGGRQRDAARALDGGRRTAAQGRGPGGARGRGPRAGNGAGRAGHRPHAPAPRRPGSPAGGDGGDRARGELEPGGRRGGRGDARAPVRRRASVGGAGPPRGGAGAGNDRAAALPAAARAADVRPAPRGRARGDPQRRKTRRRRLHLRAAAGLAAAAPAAEGVGAAGAGRLRRGRHRHARLLPPRPGRRHLGPPPHPLDAGADSVAEDGGRAGRRAERTGWLPAVQGDQRPAPPAAVAPAVHAGCRPRAAAPRAGIESLFQLSEPPLQPGPPGPLGQGHAAGAGAEPEAGTHGRPALPAAGPGLPVEGHLGRAVVARARRNARARPAPRSTWTTCSTRRPASESCRCWKICRSRRRSGAATSC